jgi:hypothetical protein
MRGLALDSKSIEVLDSTALSAVLNPASDGQMAETYLCNIRWSSGDIEQGYVKIYRKSRNLALVNELTGYLLGKACDLPVPAKAAFLKLPSGVFFDKDPADPLDEWAFVLKAVPGTSPGSLYEKDLLPECEALLQVVASWNKVSDTIAFDDWIANQDRHAGNILVAGPDDIHLIDHGNLPIKLNWQAIDLDPDFESENLLVHNLKWANVTPLPIKWQIAKAAVKHPEAYQIHLTELRFWWDLLLASDPDRRSTLESFLEIRAISGSARINNQFEVVV